MGERAEFCCSPREGTGAPHLEIDESVLGIVHLWNVRVALYRRENARDVHRVAVHTIGSTQRFGECRRAADDKYAVNLTRLRSASQLFNRVGQRGSNSHVVRDTFKPASSTQPDAT